MVSRHLRAIASLPAHVTHIPNREIRAKFQCQGVLQGVHAQVVKRLQLLHELAVQDPTHICGQPVTVIQLQAIELNLRPPPTSTSMLIKEASMVGEQTACPTRGVYFKSLKSMRQHRARKHGEKVERSVTFDPAQHSTGGLPECRACKHRFKTWDALRKHVEQGSCKMMNVDSISSTTQPETQRRAVPQPPPHVDPPPHNPYADPKQSSSGLAQHAAEQQVEPQAAPDLNDTITDIHELQRAKGWKSLLQSEHVPFMRQHCVVCARWIVDTAALKRHIKYGHPKIWTACEPKLRGTCEQVQSHIKRDTTCPYCLRKAYSRHSFQCCVIFQAALLQTHHNGDGLQQSGTGHDVRPPATSSGCTAAAADQKAYKQSGRQQEAQTGVKGWGQTTSSSSTSIGWLHGGNHTTLDQERHTTRGPDQFDETRCGLHHVLRVDREDGDLDGALPSIARMACQSGQAEPKPLLTADDNDGSRVGGNGEKATTAAGRTRASRTGKATRLCGRAKQTCVSAMGSSKEDNGTGPVHEADPSAGGHPRHEGHAAEDHPRLHPQMSCATAPKGTAGRQQPSSVPPVCKPERAGGQQLALARNACWQTVGCQIRKDGMRRSGMIQALQKMTYKGQALRVF